LLKWVKLLKGEIFTSLKIENKVLQTSDHFCRTRNGQRQYKDWLTDVECHHGRSQEYVNG
jgi:hypothetical protein